MSRWPKQYVNQEVVGDAGQTIGADRHATRRSGWCSSGVAWGERETGGAAIVSQAAVLEAPSKYGS